MMRLNKRNLPTRTASVRENIAPERKDTALFFCKRQAHNLLLLLLTYLTSVVLGQHHYYWLPLLAIPLIGYGFKMPYHLLTLTLILAPLDIGLGGERDDHFPVIFSISDVLLFMALPGAVLRLRSRPEIWRMGGIGLPMLGYLAAGLLSFCVNLHAMRGQGLGYFSGWIRNAQCVLGLPLIYASLEWRWPQLRDALRGYLLCVLLMAGWGLFKFWHGLRAGLYIFGIHKNVVGLALALAALIALIGLLPIDRARRGAMQAKLFALPTPLLVGAFGIYVLALACSLSRGSLLSLLGGFVMVCILWRRPVLLAALFLLTAGVVYGVGETLHPYYRHYETDFSERSNSISDRIFMLRESERRFRAQPLLGDGFRIRRDILPHNMEAMVLAENGFIGFAFLVWGMIAQFHFLRRSYRELSQDAALQTFVVIIAVCAVALLIHGQVEPYWRRGPLLVVWAGTGMVWSLILQKRRETALPERASVLVPLPLLPLSNEGESDVEIPLLPKSGGRPGKG